MGANNTCETNQTVWCSFYDDFCQLARQTAYLSHSQYDPDRSARVLAFREQLLMRQQLSASTTYTANNDHFMADLSGPEMAQLLSNKAGSPTPSFGFLEPSATLAASLMRQQHSDRTRGGNGEVPLRCASDPIDRCAAARELLSERDLCDDVEVELLAAMAATTTTSGNQAGGPNAQLTHTNSIQSVNMGTNLTGSASDITDSPRSLDHYYGFGANYHRRSRAYSQQAHQQHLMMDQSVASQAAYSAQPAMEVPVQSPHIRLGSAIEHRALMSGVHMIQQPAAAGGQQHMLAMDAHAAMVDPQWQQPPPSKPPMVPMRHCFPEPDELLASDLVVKPPAPPARRVVSIAEPSRQQQQQRAEVQRHHRAAMQPASRLPESYHRSSPGKSMVASQMHKQAAGLAPPVSEPVVEELPEEVAADGQSSSATEQDKWSDSDADAIVRGAKETAQMALSMYQFTRGEGDLNTTQDLFTQAELFAEEANELYKEVRCFSYKVSLALISD